MTSILDKVKDEVAEEMGYPNWNEFFNWVAREGEKPDVVAQQIESAMQDVIRKEFVIKTEYWEKA